MQLNPLIISLLFSSLILCNCNRVKEVIPPHTSLIYPIIEGKYRTSLVIDTTFDTGGDVLNKYYKKEETRGTEEDNIGREVNLLHVSRSAFEWGDAREFELDRVWYQYKNPDRTGDYFAEKIEENSRSLVLKFPAYPGVSWNGNLYNSREKENFFYHRVDTAVSVQGTLYENCVMVVQKVDTLGLLNQKFAYEIYAPNIGLIKKYDRTMIYKQPGFQKKDLKTSESRVYLEEIIEHNY